MSKVIIINKIIFNILLFFIPSSGISMVLPVPFAPDINPKSGEYWRISPNLSVQKGKRTIRVFFGKDHKSGYAKGLYDSNGTLNEYSLISPLGKKIIYVKYKKIKNSSRVIKQTYSDKDGDGNFDELEIIEPALKVSNVKISIFSLMSKGKKRKLLSRYEVSSFQEIDECLEKPVDLFQPAVNAVNTIIEQYRGDTSCIDRGVGEGLRFTGLYGDSSPGSTDGRKTFKNYGPVCVDDNCGFSESQQASFERLLQETVREGAGCLASLGNGNQYDSEEAGRLMDKISRGTNLLEPEKAFIKGSFALKNAAELLFMYNQGKNMDEAWDADGSQKLWTGYETNEDEVEAYRQEVAQRKTDLEGLKTDIEASFNPINSQIRISKGRIRELEQIIGDAVVGTPRGLQGDVNSWNRNVESLGIIEAIPENRLFNPSPLRKLLTQFCETNPATIRDYSPRDIRKFYENNPPRKDSDVEFVDQAESILIAVYNINTRGRGTAAPLNNTVCRDGEFNNASFEATRVYATGQQQVFQTQLSDARTSVGEESGIVERLNTELIEEMNKFNPKFEALDLSFPEGINSSSGRGSLSTLSLSTMLNEINSTLRTIENRSKNIDGSRVYSNSTSEGEEYLRARERPLKIVCNKDGDRDLKVLYVEEQGLSYEDIDTGETIVGDSSLSLMGQAKAAAMIPGGPGWPIIRWDSRKAASNDDNKAIMFHEMMHVLGYPHKEGVPVHTACQQCCFPDGFRGSGHNCAAAVQRACAICAGNLGKNKVDMRENSAALDTWVNTQRTCFQNRNPR